MIRPLPTLFRPLPTLLVGLLLALPAPALVIDSLAANLTPPADDPGFDNVGRLGVETAVSSFSRYPVKLQVATQTKRGIPR